MADGPFATLTLWLTERTETERQIETANRRKGVVASVFFATRPSYILVETMMEPELFDVIEVLVDLPGPSLRSGVRGAIVDCHHDGTYEVEFTNEKGETVALCPLSGEQFIVVWRAKTQTWLPITEQIASLITHLPEDARREVLDFARFLHDRRQRQQAESAPDPATVSKEA